MTSFGAEDGEHGGEVMGSMSEAEMHDFIVCGHDKWGDRFAHVTFDSIEIPIPENILLYLREDGLILPKEANYPEASFCDTSFEHADYDGVDWLSAAEDTPELEQPSFPAFCECLQRRMKELGGDVFVKLNWHAPTDAAWITSSKTLKCKNIEDVFLLLKASSRVCSDVCFSAEDDSETFGKMKYVLVLKKWMDMHAGTEFRCFVINNRLYGITQRDCIDFHKHLLSSKMDILREVSSFFEQNIKNKFELDNYVFDVVRVGGNKSDIFLVDFNPFNEKLTKSYLFSWEELKNVLEGSEDFEEPEFRFISESTGIQPNFSQHFGLPLELKDRSNAEYILNEFGNSNRNEGDDNDIEEVSDEVSSLSGPDSFSESDSNPA
ncbi:translation initiation factor eIF2 assembly protein [Bemisia tabaci]